MKELLFEKLDSQAGQIKGILRVNGRIVYMKINSNQYTAQMISQLESKGAIINQGSGRNWIRINIFPYEKIKDNSLVKIGGKEFDLNETSNEEVENLLIQFFTNQYTKAGFKCLGGSEEVAVH